MLAKPEIVIWANGKTCHFTVVGDRRRNALTPFDYRPLRLLVSLGHPPVLKARSRAFDRWFLWQLFAPLSVWTQRYRVYQRLTHQGWQNWLRSVKPDKLVSALPSLGDPKQKISHVNSVALSPSSQRIIWPKVVFNLGLAGFASVRFELLVRVK